MNYAVSIDNITKRYGQIVALENVCLQIHYGELVGLIGPDGAGKSSLFRIIASLASPDEGHLDVLGLDPTTDCSAIRSKIGYMPERFSLYQDLTVMENLNFFASLFGVDVKKNLDIIAPVFRQLERFPDRKAGALSGGMKQKLALCCALIHRPKLLLLDEPTTGVDAISRNEFWDILSELQKKEMTILVSTSYMDEATRCGRVAMINRGKILEVDTPAGLVSRFNENIFNVVSSDMFSLLAKLREMPEVIDCYTFGASIHAVVCSGFNPAVAENSLSASGLNNVKIYPAKASIEDLFIKLTRNEHK